MEKQKILYQSEVGTTSVFDRVLNYINEKYEIRYNEISLEFEIKLKNEDWNELNINSLFVEILQSGISISMNKLEIFLRSHLIKKYNPITEYFTNLPQWNGENHIEKLAKFVQTTDEKVFLYHFEKWLTRAVLCSFKAGYVNKQCLILFNTKQNTGKTSFLRFLIPKKLAKYYTEDISVDKDGLIALCKNLIINIDELSVMSKTDVNVLKSFISKSAVNTRLPYERKAQLMERCCSFVGSTNRSDFLTDETGSVRWLIFEVLKIDFSYSEVIDIDKVWSQAFYNAFKRKDFIAELSAEDILENEKRNEKFKQISIEQEVISVNFEKSDNDNDFLTATDIMLLVNQSMGIKLNNIKIGKALVSLGYQRFKHSQKQIYGYSIRKKQEF